jgi:Protein of unknown function (DUF3048) N-terminal domain/Protein of unknown function (DUF3048) C-terminal domain
MYCTYIKYYNLFLLAIVSLTFFQNGQAGMLSSPFTEQLVVQENLLKRLYAIIIDNASLARPHDGLSKAPLVFEALVEGGLTRYCAFYFHEKPEKVGPIRSIRHYFLDIACGYAALPVHFGFSYIALDQIQKENIPTISGTRHSHEIFWRDQLRKAPNNVYTSIENIINEANRLGIKPVEPKIFAYFGEPNLINEQAQATEIILHFSPVYSVKYVYCHDTKRYKRFIAQGADNEKDFHAHMDQGYQEQITAKNILLLQAHTETIPGDTCDRQDIMLHTSGEGFYIAHGMMMNITWYKEHRYAPFVFLDINNEQLILYPGNTWVEIFPHYAECIIA